MSKQGDLVSVSQGASGDPLYIDTTNDRVGIGTSSPSRTLEVDGSGNRVASFTHSAGTYSFATFSDTNTTDDGQVRIGALTNDLLVFAGGSERMRIDSSGNLLIGTTTTPTNSGAYFEGGTDPILNIGGTSTSNTGRMRFRNPNGIVGSITTNGSSTAFNTTSDYRLKENLTPLSGAADRLAQIPVHRFNFIADPDTTVDGFLAHEVQAIVPEAITGEHDGVDADGNPEYQGIDQSKLVPLLTAALQEALQKIDALEARVAELEAV